MKIFNNLGIIAAGIAVSLGVMQGEARAAIFNKDINLNAKENTTSNSVTVDLLPGFYSVRYIGTNNGGVYDGWNAWGRVTDCNDIGENCRRGWLNNYSISFPGFRRTLSSRNVYSTELQALQNSVSTFFVLDSKTTVNFFINDSIYDDNTGGVSLRLSSNISTLRTVPESISILGLLTVGTIGLATLKVNKQVV